MKKGVDPMILLRLLKMIQKFKKAGSFDVQSDRGKKRIDSTVVEEVAIAVQEESIAGMKPCSARGIAQTLNRPESMGQTIPRNILHCYPHKISHLQELFPSDQPKGILLLSCSHGCGQRTALKKFVDRRSLFPSDRIY